MMTIPSNSTSSEVMAVLKKKYGIDLSVNVEDAYKPIIFIWGGKGDGKTTTMLNSPGTKTVISFDSKSAIIKSMLVRKGLIKNEDVKVFNISDRVAHIPPPEQGSVAIDLAIELIRLYPAESIVLDAMEEAAKFAEWKMRFNHKLPVGDGFKELNWWKQRTAYLSSLKRTANENSKYVVWLSSWDKDQPEDIAGNDTRKSIASWLKSTIGDADIVLHQYEEDQPSKGKNKYTVIVQSDKDDRVFTTGTMIDVSDFKPLITQEKWEHIKTLVDGTTKAAGLTNAKMISSTQGLDISPVPQSTEQQDSKPIEVEDQKNPLDDISI